MLRHQGLVELARCRSDLSVHLHGFVVQGMSFRFMPQFDARLGADVI
jgi:hypothetical protein